MPRAMGRWTALTLMLLLTCMAAPLLAQTVVGRFHHPVSGGVHAIVEQADGKLLIGGEVRWVGGHTRDRIARLNADGTLDHGFQAGADGIVRAVAVQADGKLLIGGSFTHVNGQPRAHLARLNPDGALDPTFSAGVDGDVCTLVVQPDGKILVGGTFGQAAGQPRQYLARLSANGTLDAGFRPHIGERTYGRVNVVLVQPDGKVLVGGSFDRVDGTPQANLARLNADGTRDPGFNRSTNSYVSSLALQADGKILVGGGFSYVGLDMRHHIARFTAGGDLDIGFSSPLDPVGAGPVAAIIVQPDGKILLGGNFSAGGSQVMRNVVRAHADGTLDTGFSMHLNNHVLALARRPTGRILIGGIFNTINDSSTDSQLIQVTVNGVVEPHLDVSVSNAPQAVALQPDDKVLIGGIFSVVQGQLRPFLARLNPDLTLDTGFHPVIDGEVASISVLSDSKILIAGDFTEVNGQARRGIARLNADGTLDAGFNAAVNSWVYAVALQPDGKILISGNFTQVGGQSRNHLARLNADGSLDAGFNPNADGLVRTLLVLADGKVMAGGDFLQMGGQARPYLARLNANGSLDTGFNLGVDRPIFNLAHWSLGSVLVGGAFTQIGGKPRRYLAVLDYGSSVSDTSVLDINGAVNSMVVDHAGGLTIAGEFTQVNGQPRQRIAQMRGNSLLAESFNVNGEVAGLALDQEGRFVAVGHFTQVNGWTTGHVARLKWSRAFGYSGLLLSEDRTRLQWSRKYDQPQLHGVWFERSSGDGQWIRLGAPTLEKVGGYDLWTLDGLDLPRTPTVWLRARGYANGGGNNNSNSLIGAVARVDLAERTPVSAALAGGQGSVTPSTQDVVLGEDAYFSLHPEAGWHVATVSGTTCTPADQGDGLWRASNIQAPCAVSVTFAQNPLPQATAQTVPVAFNVAKPITLAGSDPHAGEWGFTYALATQPAHGTLSGFNATTGSLTYTPTLGYSGSDRFSFTVRTISGTSLAAEVSLTVAAPAPVTATPQSVAVTFNTNRQVAVSGIDPNPGGPHTRTYAIATPPTHGAITNFNAATGLLSYMPTLGYSGTDSFTFTTTTVNGTSAPATVTLTIAPGQPVQAWGYTEDVAFNTPRAIALVAGDPNRGGPFVFTYAIVAAPSHGTIGNFDTVNGTLTYTPVPGYSGTDRFSFTASTVNGTSAPAETTLIVAAAEPPMATAQTVSVPFNTAQSITLAGTDPNAGGPFALTHALVDVPSYGTISGFDAATGTLTYTPTLGRSGSDRFRFTVTTVNGTSAPADVTLSIAEPDPVTATAQAVDVAYNTAKAITLSGNDPNPGGPFALTYALVDQPGHGTISGFDAASGTLTYTPDLGHSGDDRFTFTVTTTNGTSVPAAVDLRIVEPQLALSIDDGRDFAYYGQVVDYAVTLSNAGDAANAIPVRFMLSEGFDGDHARIACLGDDEGASCVADAVDPLLYTVSLPPGRSLTWLLAVPVRGDAEGEEVTLSVSAIGATPAIDVNTLVIFKDGFDVPHGNGAQRVDVIEGAQARALFDGGGDAGLVETLPVTVPRDFTAGRAVATLMSVRHANREVRVDAMAVGDTSFVRLLARDARGERVSAWSGVEAGATLRLGSVAGLDAAHRVLMLDGAQAGLVLEFSGE